MSSSLGHRSDASPSVRVRQQPLAPQAFQLVKHLYNHNPFYVASAWMVFRGLWASFNVQGGAFDTWMLTLGLTGYTLLLAATAFVIVRWGKVWDDARSLLMLVVLMLLGLSVTYDHVLADGLPGAAEWCLGGWLFAVAVSEGLLAALRLKLPLLFRIPYHLLLGLFFLYPLSLTSRLETPDDPVLQWQLFGFAPAAALVLAGLLPAVRRGANYVRGNGSPWAWPWYPWVMFGLLAACAALRSYYMCLSLHFVGYANSIFGPYFLVPLVLAIGLLLMEEGIVSRRAAAQRWGLAMPAVALLLAGIGHRDDPVYSGFLTIFFETVRATPLYVTVLLAIAFYGLAAVRRVAWAGELLTAALVVWAFVSRDPSWSGCNTLPHCWPLAAAGFVQLAIGLQRRTSRHLLAAGTALTVAAAIGWRATWFTAWHGALPWHLWIGSLLVIGLLCRDALAHRLQWAGAGLLALIAACVALDIGGVASNLPAAAIVLYPPLAGVIVFGYGFYTRQAWAFAALGSAPLVGWLLAYGSRLYASLRANVVGLNQLLWGLLFFLCAAGISLLKTGLLRRWYTWPARVKPPSGEAAQQ